MCTYNAQKYLEEQLQSIADSTVKDFVIHIFDDGSTDKTLEVIKSFQRKHSDCNIKCEVNENNLGAWRNFLVGVQKVGNKIIDDDYIMLSDQDDIWKDDKISLTYNAMKMLEKEYGKDKPLLVSTDVTLIDEDKNILSKSYAARNNFNTSHTDLPHALMENHVQGCTIMINKTLADAVTEIPYVATMHDAWLSLIAISLGHIAYLNKQTMYYRDISSSVTGHNKTYREDLKSKWLTLNKQRQIVLAPIPMYKEFIRIYGHELQEEDMEAFNAYIGLDSNGFIRKRYDIVHMRLWKTGFMRNAGLMMLV